MNNSIVQLKIEQVNQPESSAVKKPENLVAVPRNRFLISNNEQTVMWLSPRSMVPEDHIVWFINEAVNRLDLRAFVAGSGGTDARGRHSYDPVMLVKLIVYCRATGRHSSRQIEKAAQEDIPCRLLTSGQQPHHDTIANFENVNREALANLYTQSLNLATQADLIELDIVAVDGSKIKASASRHKAMSFGRMKTRIGELRKEIKKIKKSLKKRSLAASQKRKLNADLEFKTSRVNTIIENKQELENRVAAEFASKQEIVKSKQRSNKPESKTQINFTDRESRIMRKGKGFEQAYNAQVVVDKRAQIIVAQSVTQEGNDKLQLVPMSQQVKINMGRSPNRVLGDTGYSSEEALSAPELADIDLFVPPVREKNYKALPPMVGRIPADISQSDRMKRKLRTTAGRAMYAIRKGLVEPVFGQIKRCMRFSEFTVRGLVKAQQEWSFMCALHNLLKICRHEQKVARIQT